jgi:hypothetical protein
MKQSFQEDSNRQQIRNNNTIVVLFSFEKLPAFLTSFVVIVSIPLLCKASAKETLIFSSK